MNKVITLVPFISLCLLVHVRTGAQPVIVNATDLPPAGFTSGIFNGQATVAPGSGGAGVTWDLSTVALTNVGTYTILNPTSTPVSTSFPSADHALSVVVGANTYYSFYITGSNDQKELANSVTTVAGSGADYTPAPRQILKFPFNYTDTFTAVYATGTYTGVDFVEYDGYGTLITPWGTYNDVARIKTTYTSSVGYVYNWYTLHPLVPVMSYSSIPNSYTGLNMVPTKAAHVKNIPSVSLSPNPFTNNAVLRISTENGTRNAFVVVTDLAGRAVKRVPVSGPETTINREGLSAGIYSLEVYNNGERIAYEKLVIE